MFAGGVPLKQSVVSPARLRRSSKLRISFNPSPTKQFTRSTSPRHIYSVHKARTLGADSVTTTHDQCLNRFCSPFRAFTCRGIMYAPPKTEEREKVERHMGNVRRFAPLGGTAKDDGLPKLKGIVFDVDGTLCEPQTYMFGLMRQAISITKEDDILEHIYSLPAEEQQAAMEKIRAIEREAMVNQTPQPGLVELMGFLESQEVSKGICTRNFDAPVMHLLEKFLKGKTFYPIITREFRPPKPDPAGILHIAKEWGLPDASELIMVGDSLDDMTAGYRAGAATVLLVNDVNAHLATHEHTDLCIRRLDELVGILQGGFVGRVDATDEPGDAASGLRTRERAENVLRQGRGET